jgi:deoxyribodipyrimidine photolyase-related protein
VNLNRPRFGFTPRCQGAIWILGDQLLLDHPALHAAEALTDRAHIRVVLVESAQRLAKLPYQRKKLVLLLSAMRHYAQALRARRLRVDYRQAASSGAGCAPTSPRGSPRLFTMAAAEHRGRIFQTQRLAELLHTPVTVLPNTQFLVGRYDPYPAPDKKVILENFYRAQRKHWGCCSMRRANRLAAPGISTARIASRCRAPGWRSRRSARLRRTRSRSR